MWRDYRVQQYATKSRGSYLSVRRDCASSDVSFIFTHPPDDPTWTRTRKMQVLVSLCVGRRGVAVRVCAASRSEYDTSTSIRAKVLSYFVSDLFGLFEVH